MPGVIVAVADLGFVRSERDSAGTLVWLKLDDAGLNWAVKILRR